MSEHSVDRDRRNLLQVGAAVLATPLLGVGVARAAAPTGPRSLPGTEGAERPQVPLGAAVGEGPMELVAPLVPGLEVGFGWRFTRLSAVDRGAMLLQLERDGVDARVHVCRRAGPAAGVASTEQLDFLLMNEERGNGASDEELARAIRLVASLVGANEAEVPVQGLLTHEERVAAFGSLDGGALL